jgi:hypothetical protein
MTLFCSSIIRWHVVLLNNKIAEWGRRRIKTLFKFCSSITRWHIDIGRQLELLDKWEKHTIALR